jgi:hypothetical protein
MNTYLNSKKSVLGLCLCVWFPNQNASETVELDKYRSEVCFTFCLQREHTHTSLTKQTRSCAKWCDDVPPLCNTTHSLADTMVFPAVWMGGAAASYMHFQLSTLRFLSLQSPQVTFMWAVVCEWWCYCSSDRLLTGTWPQFICKELQYSGSPLHKFLNL